MKLLNAPSSLPSEGAWLVEVELSLSEAVKPSSFIGATSRWCVLVGANYPLGSICVYPAKKGGIEATFPHQTLNEPGDAETTWRTGKLCLDRPTARLGSVLVGHPPQSAEDKLPWHLSRALDWIDAAAQGTLLRAGHPFELPQVRTVQDFRVVHDESVASFAAWKERLGRWGTFKFERVPGAPKALLVGSYHDLNGDLVRRALRTAPADDLDWKGFWWLWSQPITLPPWKAPGTWGELRAAGRRQGINADATLRQIVARSRALEAPMLLLGFPIPRLVGGPPLEVHWQAILLPGRSANPKAPKGFRDNSAGRWYGLLRGELAESRKLPNVLTENWHPDRTQARGRLAPELRDRRVAVIGVGALGAAVAELLVRGGVSQVLLVDGDDIEIGNLVRHSLDLRHVGVNKAEAVAEKLRLAAPMARVDAVPRYLPLDADEARSMLADADVVIDCTAEDAVAAALGKAWWPRPKLFLSASVGYAGKRVFLFSAVAARFPHEQVLSEVSPWLSQERRRWADAGETLEGAGCWSPLFPARLDDLWIAAVATVKRLELVLTQRRFGAELDVLEVGDHDGRLVGLARVEAHA